MKIEKIEYNFVCNTYKASQIVEVVPNCNSITITNTGDATATIKGITLYPGTIGSILGDSISFGGNLGEVLSDKRIEISFGAGANPAVQIIQKFYR